MKNIIKVLVALSVLIVIGIAGCGTKASTLENTTWVLESYGKPGNPQAVLEDTEITVTFDSEKGQFAGSAGCNSYFGGHEVKGGKLSIPGPIGATMMACGEQIDKQERQYLDALQAAESFRVEDSELRITCGEQALIFKQK